MPTGNLQGDLQEKINTAVNQTRTFNGSLHALADVMGIPSSPVSGRTIAIASKFDPTITTASPALNYLLANTSVLPSMGVDFTSSQTLDSRITFTRASTATYFNSVGVLTSAAIDAPRFDYDPATLAARGLLIEEQRTNLVLNSLLNGTNLSTQSVTVSATAYTLSFYGTGSITLSGAATATVNGSGAFPTRTSYTFTPTAGTLTLTVSGTVQYAQLEAGSFATSFIPTAGTALTRAADVASMTGANFSSWYNASAGTLFAEYSVAGYAPASAFPLTTAISDGTTSNRINISSTNVSTNLYPFGEVQAGGVAQAGLYGFSAYSFGVNSARRTVVTYAANDFAFTTQGATAQTDAAGSVPTVDRLSLGAGPVGNSLNGHIRRIAYYPRRLSNTELQAITA